MSASSFTRRLFQLKAQRLKQLGELAAVEDHALEDGVDEGLQGVGTEAVLPGDAADLSVAPLGLESLVAGADLLFIFCSSEARSWMSPR